MSGTDPFSPEQLLLQRRFVGALARRLVADAAQVDDVAQETWLELLTSKAPPRSLSWLRAVVRNVVRQLGRSEGRRRAREEQVARAAPTLAPATDEIAGRLELQRRLIERVLALPALHKEIVLLHFYEECTVKQAAARSGSRSRRRGRGCGGRWRSCARSWNGELGGERAGLLALSRAARRRCRRSRRLGRGSPWRREQGRARERSWSSRREGGDSGAVRVHSTEPLRIDDAGRARGSEAADANAPLAAARVNEPTPASRHRPHRRSSTVSVGARARDVGTFDAKTPIERAGHLFSEERPPAIVDAVDEMTDGNGDFFADHVSSRSVIATAAGFTAFTGSSTTRDSRSANARGGSPCMHERDDGSRSVFKEAEIDGVVLDPKGAPVAGARRSGSRAGPAAGPRSARSSASPMRFGRFHCRSWNASTSSRRTRLRSRLRRRSRSAAGRRPTAVSRSSSSSTRAVASAAASSIRPRAPVGHAFVYASGPGATRECCARERQEHPPARTTRTHDDGTFEIEGAPVGEVHLVVRARDHAPVWERFTSTARA
jgi:RNA polymerase sigma factor (sigma-70 family)